MKLGIFFVIVAALFIGGQAQLTVNGGQAFTSYSLPAFLDPFGLTRPRPALFSLTSMSIGRLPFFGGFAPMQPQPPKPSGQGPSLPQTTPQTPPQTPPQAPKPSEPPSEV